MSIGPIQAFVMRDGDDVSALSVSDLDDDQRAELHSAVGALIGLGVAGAEGAEVGAEFGGSVDAGAPWRSSISVPYRCAMPLATPEAS